MARTFLIGLAVALVAAWLAPSLGAKGGLLHADVVSTVGIMLIFFLQGVQLPAEQIARALLAWKFHLFVQVSTFVIFPLLCLGMLWGAGGALPESLRLGFLYLAILPTTISSAVILVTAAGGDAPAAIFSTAISNVLGVFIVPAGSVWLLSVQRAADVPAGLLLWKVAQLLLFPLIAGQLLRPWLKEAAARHRKQIGRLSNFIILFLVYAAFWDSIMGGMWSRHGWSVALAAGAGSLFLLLTSTWLVWQGARLAGFDFGKRVTALFCASQKTLAAGVPLAGAIFGTLSVQHPGSGIETGLILLPLMFYHPLQLTLGGLMLPWLQSQTQAAQRAGVGEG